MSKLVEYEKKWMIQTREDYDRAMDILDKNEMSADMSDDFQTWERERREVQWQRNEVRKQALELGLITPHEDEFRHWSDK